MNENWNKNIDWPNLRQLNAGNQLDEQSTGAVNELFNMVVEALIYLYYKGV